MDKNREKSKGLMPEIGRIWEVMDPVAPTGCFKFKPADRHKTLAGKRIGLFWNRKPNGDIFLSNIGKQLKNRFSGITIEFLTGKYDPAGGAPASAIREAADKCDAVILMTAD